MYARFIKRPLDIVLALSGLVILSPLLIVLGLIVVCDLGWPVLFLQERVGLFGKSFRMAKFRTMSDNCDADGRLLPDERRVSRTGRFLRIHALDELPQLFDVLRGRMSLVGPRPLPVAYRDHMTDRQQSRQRCRPGITGLAQIAGRNELSWDARFECDLRYTETMSFGVDFKILLGTIPVVLRRVGINPDGRLMVPEPAPLRIHKDPVIDSAPADERPGRHNANGMQPDRSRVVIRDPGLAKSNGAESRP